MTEPNTALLPTRSHTWVEPSSVSWGWLAGTRPIWSQTTGPDSERAAAWDVFARLRDVFELPSNSNARSQWYRRGFAFDDGTAAVFWDGVGAAGGGLMLTVRQSAFERLGSADADALVRSLAPGLHVSRIDLAADAATSDRLTPTALYDLLPAARSRSRPAHRTLTISADGAEKLTINSRASQRYLRIYVKGDVVRHEIELKQAAAADAMQRLLGGVSLQRVWAAEYLRVVSWPL